jgi:hypothetical protein
VALVWGLLITLVVSAAMVGLMLWVRRGAPAGSRFQDGDRASGVFGVLATTFAILAGFVVFLAFESYDTSRSGAETEARVIAQQFEIVQFLPAPAAKALTGELGCYARNVVHREWPEMADGNPPNANPWGVALFRTLRATDPRSATEQAAYAKYLDQRADQEMARQDRVHGAEGVIPTPLWIVLGLSATILFAYMLFFADSGERRLTQAMLMGSVAAVVTSLLLLLWFLDNPFHGGVGSLQPVAMERTLSLIDQQAPLIGGVTYPCGPSGVARG